MKLRSIRSSVAVTAALALACGKLFGRGHDAGPDVQELSDPLEALVPDAARATASVDAGPCPRPIHGPQGVGYCRFRCRSWTDRQATKHARRVSSPAQAGFGKCGTNDVFAEVDHHDAGVTEFFDPKTGQLVGAIDTLTPGCSLYGEVPNCAPRVGWKPASPAKGGSAEDDGE
jgi:hypothetical protein